MELAAARLAVNTTRAPFVVPRKGGVSKWMKRALTEGDRAYRVGDMRYVEKVQAEADARGRDDGSGNSVSVLQ
jgi:hypothetical protein